MGHSPRLQLSHPHWGSVEELWSNPMNSCYWHFLKLRHEKGKFQWTSSISFNSVNIFEGSLVRTACAALCISPTYVLFLLSIAGRPTLQAADTIIFFKHTPDRVTSPSQIPGITSNDLSKVQNVINDSSPPSPLTSLIHPHTPDMQSCLCSSGVVLVGVFCAMLVLSLHPQIAIVSFSECELIGFGNSHVLLHRVIHVFSRLLKWLWTFSLECERWLGHMCLSMSNPYFCKSASKSNS